MDGASPLLVRYLQPQRLLANWGTFFRHRLLKGGVTRAAPRHAEQAYCCLHAVSFHRVCSTCLERVQRVKRITPTLAPSSFELYTCQQIIRTPEH
jgi:hypothetical protein